MEITADNFSDVLMAKIKERVAFNAQNCDKIGQRIGADISGRIISGEAQPALAASTVKAKKARGYSQPETPLYAKGDYAARFAVEFVSEDEAWIVNKSGLSPQWHNLRERSQSVVDKNTLKTVLQEELNGNV